MMFKDVNVTLSNHATGADPGGFMESPLKALILLDELLPTNSVHQNQFISQISTHCKQKYSFYLSSLQNHLKLLPQHLQAQ